MGKLFFIHESVSLVVFLIVNCDQAKVEFCIRGKYQFVMDNLKEISAPKSTFIDALDTRKPVLWTCRNGVIFHQPTSLQNVVAKDETFCYKKSICDEQWICHFQKKQIFAEVLKVGKPDRHEHWMFEEGDKTLAPLTCEPSQDFSLTAPKIREKRQVNGLIPSELASHDIIQREVDDQTKRLFYYLAGINEEPVNSHLRIVKLFKISIQLASMICDPQFVKQKFLQEIERGFLYLLKEQGFDKMVDIDLESYDTLRDTLEECGRSVHMVRFSGRPCPTGTKVSKVYRLENSIRQSIDYEPSEKSFSWGKYDIIMEGAWSTMSIVHGGCFASFRSKVNLLHKFEVALEQLFHSALYLRWERPTKLTDETFYDNILMGKVNQTLEAMDACARYLYLKTPFKSQLNRPIHETIYRRKKRSAQYASMGDNPSATSLVENYLENERDFAHGTHIINDNDRPTHNCFSSEKERLEITKLLKNKCQ